MSLRSHSSLRSLLSSALAIVCSVGGVAGIAGGVSLLASVSAAAQNFGWTFTYQGELKENGQLVNGNRAMTFRLFDDAAGTIQVGNDIAQNVAVTNGKFTVNLDFTEGNTIAGIFDGSDRWVQVQVGATILTPMQKIQTTPHAAVASLFAVPLGQDTVSPLIMHLISRSEEEQVRAFLVETTGGAIGNQAITGIHWDDDNEGVGVAGVSHSGNGFGVTGVNLAPGGNNTGIYGVSISPNGNAIFGYATASSGPNRAIYGRTESPDGYAGYFEGRGYFEKPLGVGTENPVGMLDVTTNSTFATTVTMWNSSVGGHRWQLNSTGSAHPTGVGNLEFFDRTANASRLVLRDDGFVGIGRATQVTSAEDFGIQANAANGQFGGMYINTTGDTGWPFYGYATGGDVDAYTYYQATVAQWRLNCGGDRLAVNLTNGNTGIGTTSPAFLLHVNGTAGKPGGGSWANASDARLKKNIEPLDGALDRLMRLRGVTFEYIDPASINERPGERIGVIAQEVESVFPDWVDAREDGYKAVTFRGFEALTIEAMRELRDEKDAEIARLRSVNESQANELDDLRARMSALEAMVEALCAAREGN
jgi:hypothetical protein